jgi:hypothetical protein
MTRNLALLSALALCLGALQLRAQAKPTDGEGPVCLDGSGATCKIVETTKCERWEPVQVGGGYPPSGSVRLECTKKSTTTETYYYEY